MLIYSKYQLFWVYGKSWGKDGGKVTREDYFPNELSSRSLISSKILNWLFIIEEYSLRKLNNPLDKLPALSSTAGYFEKYMEANTRRACGKRILIANYACTTTNPGLEYQALYGLITGVHHPGLSCQLKAVLHSIDLNTDIRGWAPNSTSSVLMLYPFLKKHRLGELHLPYKLVYKKTSYKQF
jgi:hypothetical protein